MLTLKMTSNCKQFKGGLIMISVWRYAKYTVYNNFSLSEQALQKELNYCEIRSNDCYVNRKIKYNI